MKNNERRKNYFIDKSFQSKFILRFCVIIIVTSVLTAAAIYYFNRQTTTVAFENLRVVVKSTSDFIMPIIFEILAIVAIIGGCATIFITMYTSHKIAGPLFKLDMELSRLKKGDFSSIIRIRATDQLQRVATQLDELRMGMKDSIGDIKVNFKELKSQIDSDMENEKIAQTIESIDDLLNRFKTD